MPKIDIGTVKDMKMSEGRVVRAAKGIGWAWDWQPAPVGDGNILNLSVAPDNSANIPNHWLVESFNPLIMYAVPGQTSALTGWPFLAKAATRYRISWDFETNYTWSGGDRYRVREDATGSNTGKLFSAHTSAPLIDSREFYNVTERTLWIGPAAVISGTQRLKVNKFLLEIVA